MQTVPLNTVGPVIVPCCGPPQTVAVNVSPKSGSTIGEQTVTGVSSSVVTSGKSITGGSFTGVIVIYTRAVSQYTGMPVSQMRYVNTSVPL